VLVVDGLASLVGFELSFDVEDDESDDDADSDDEVLARESVR
jgi:hypothetical protein